MALLLKKVPISVLHSTYSLILYLMKNLIQACIASPISPPVICPLITVWGLNSVYTVNCHPTYSFFRFWCQWACTYTNQS